jgi:hypothetical protein
VLDDLFLLVFCTIVPFFILLRGIFLDCKNIVFTEKYRVPIILVIFPGFIGDLRNVLGFFGVLRSVCYTE